LVRWNGAIFVIVWVKSRKI